MEKSNKIFLYLTVLFLVFGGIIIVGTSKGDVVLFFNERRNEFFNLFFKNITHLGDGLILIPLLLVHFL